MNVVSGRPHARGVKSFLTVCLFLLFSASTQAGTIVRINTSIGDFSIELLDEVAPITVQNFLNYVNRNDYNGTYFHRVVDNFVAQGGGFRFQLFVGPIDVPADPPIVNEFNVSNTRGTVAMAKFEGDPDSATSQWFVNLVDNSANLDNNNGGFTVFANVLGEGMVVLDALDALPKVNLGDKASDAPYFTPGYRNPLDFVYMNAEVVDRFSGAPHVYEVARELLITSVNIDDGSDVISMNFNLVPSQGQVLLQANLESVIPRRDFTGIATFSSSDNRLRIPILEINNAGTITQVNNVVFALSSTDPVQFVLESFDQ